MHSSTYTLEDQERMAKARNYLAWQCRLILPELGLRVVEVGCGVGNFTGQLLDRQTVIALDPEPDCVERLQQRYPRQANLHALVCDPCQACFADLARFHPDSCVCVNVLEHIQDDRQALEAMASILESGGTIVLFVPAFPALYGPVDRNLEHFRRYRRRDIARLAHATGLRLKKAHYVNLAGFFGWWMNAHVLKREAQSERQIEIFDRFIVPVLSRCEAVAPPPFGQSLLAVLEKP